ncbi:MAG: 1,4-dihydroxy-2-naphthoate polyprenyltransferase [Pseudomonadota bacterium]
MFAKIYPWLLAFRFKTLTAALVPVMVATALCVSLDVFHETWVSVYALLGAFAIQIATNLLNDAIDFKKGADTEERLGPQRVTQSGLLSEKQVWAMGIFFLVVATLLGVPLVLRGGAPIIVLGLVSLFLAYGYTGGPFPLAYLGLGDLFVILFFGLFAVAGTSYLHSLTLHPAMIVAGLQTGFLSTVLIAINNLRDSETDREVNKKTLAVRFGDGFARFEIALLVALTYLLNLYYLVVYQKLYVLISFAVLPFGVFLVGVVYATKDKRQLNKALGLAALHQVVFALLFSIGLVL